MSNMGNSAYATLAWGVDVYDPDDGYDWNDEAAASAHMALGDKLENFYDSKVAAVLGWTEEHPGWPDHLHGLSRLEREASDEYKAHQAQLEAYSQRREAAVPVELDKFGYELGSTALVVKRTRTRIEWSCVPVDAATLEPPTEAERAALNAVLDHLGFTGDREPKLLLYAK